MSPREEATEGPLGVDVDTSNGVPPPCTQLGMLVPTLVTSLSQAAAGATLR